MGVDSLVLVDFWFTVYNYLVVNSVGVFGSLFIGNDVVFCWCSEWVN